MGTPLPILTIIVCYIYTVKVLGPRFMKNRKPYEIKPLIAWYNLLMVLLSGFIFLYGGQLTYLPPGGQYDLFCQPIDYRFTPETMRIRHLGWWIMLLKITEFADTVIRISYLHIVLKLFFL